MIHRIEPFSLTFSGKPWAELPSPVPGIRALISTRAAGDMGIDPGGDTPARRAFYQSLGIDPARTFACRQTHSKIVSEIAVPSSDRLRHADGLVTRGGAVLTVTVGDCLPVFLFDTVTRAYAVCHSGWKGTGIAVNALELMRERFGTNPEHVAAILGPCIRGDDYEVDAERAHRYEAEFGGREAPARSGGGSHAVTRDPLGPVTREVTDVNRCTKSYFLDMQAANAHLLVTHGVRTIAYCTNSTLTDERLGSFRREGAHFTRMMALITDARGTFTTPPV